MPTPPAEPKNRNFRFGLITTEIGGGSQQWTDKAVRAETSGFSILLVPDHIPMAVAPMPMMAAAAAATTTLRVGSFVFANDFRHPTLLAKEAATLDVLTDGRFELGIGAGWLDVDYEQTGIPFDPPGVRIDRLIESVRVIKALFDDGPVTFEGEHYRVKELEGTPKPVQKPVPLMIGGGGKRILELAANEATIVSVVAQTRDGAIDMSTGGNDLTRERVDRLQRVAGERFDELELNSTVFAAVETDDRDATAAKAGAEQGIAPEVLLNSPHFLFGTRSQMREQLLRQREAYGISYYSFFEHNLDTVEPLVTELAGT